MGLDMYLYARPKNDDHQVAYWRKANAIHGWFVREAQNGVDECQHSLVHREQLQELIDTCSKVLLDHSLAEELLPPERGCFFGTYEYDDWYFTDLENTVTELTAVLADKGEDYEFYYNSSW